jgi:dTMP kinase
MFITLEGIDGVGKSTQAKMLCDALNVHRCILTHEPGGTPFGMRVREIIKTEPDIGLKSQFHLIEAQRAHHVERVILPELSAGGIVICDRFIDTSYVYQHDYMSEEEWEEYLTYYPIVPNITFLLYSDDISGLKARMAARQGVPMDHFDNASVSKLLRMQSLFSHLATKFHRIMPINSDRPIDVVFYDIWTKLQVHGRSPYYNEGFVRSQA